MALMLLNVDIRPRQIEVIGKNLFYFFGTGPEEAMVHFHFGMSGAFKTHSLPGKEPTPTTRLQLVNEEEDIVAQLSAMTVNLGSMGEARSRHQIHDWLQSRSIMRFWCCSKHALTWFDDKSLVGLTRNVVDLYMEKMVSLGPDPLR
jgi:hypothetical protein